MVNNCPRTTLNSSFVVMVNNWFWGGVVMVSMVFQGGFTVFVWFPWFFKLVSWFLVGFRGFSRWFHGFSWFLVSFHGFSR